MFYVNKKKIIPKNLGEYLTPLSLAIWFMGDGSISHKSARFATNCFTHTELDFLVSILKTKFDLDVTIQNSGKNKGHILYVKLDSMGNFKNIIKPYMLPSLLYKLGDNS